VVKNFSTDDIVLPSATFNHIDCKLIVNTNFNNEFNASDCRLLVFKGNSIYNNLQKILTVDNTFVDIKTSETSKTADFRIYYY
jgi:hypothetical protein